MSGNNLSWMKVLYISLWSTIIDPTLRYHGGVLVFSYIKPDSPRVMRSVWCTFASSFASGVHKWHTAVRYRGTSADIAKFIGANFFNRITDSQRGTLRGVCPSFISMNGRYVTKSSDLILWYNSQFFINRRVLSNSEFFLFFFFCKFEYYNTICFIL